MNDKNLCFVTMKHKDECLHCYKEKVKYEYKNLCENLNNGKALKQFEKVLRLEE